MKRKLIASALFATTVFANAATPADTTIVLVHGAFADGSSWDKVIPILHAKGYKVVSVQNPLSSLADDVAATQRVVDAQTGKVVLVGHSWGGTVITEAGTSDKIKALVYVAAFAPSEGEASGNLGKNYAVPPGVPTLTADATGYLWLPADSVAKNFAQDVPAATARMIYATQGPIAAKAFSDTTTVAAWKNKANYYIVAEKDRMIAPELQQAFAKKLKAVTTSLPTSHVPMVSQPAKVAEVIIAAAQG
ncbi:alpha/beta fold hydrolase [Duganella sp. FT94W]|uniref:Alpha/beta fold hydrolase n=1 Tax=Duganella lactea TaxID=2692173 RepID=A0ABW9V888_9BURK|nr:alpha/beta hydrolase [Duganella lactea]MYM34962.1 alpha/beta fold hydrolase [Duganella lactea]